MNSKQELLSRIARYLMLYGSYTNNIGFLSGKMGIAIFFFHYSRYLKNKNYENFAGELIDEIYKEVHLNYQKDFRDGLSGIAWGIEYLIQNGFVSGNADEVLEDLDVKILEHDIRRVKDYSLETGLKGMSHYILSRCGNKDNANSIIPKDYIEDLIHGMSLDVNTEVETTFLRNALIKISKGESISVDDYLLTTLLRDVRYKREKIFEKNRPLGILDNGFAGIGLKLLQDER